ncbi:pyridoxamine 5'-phosphate oxidase family protein [Phaeacidiphilus oryzae]|uniref:pyridoxamine 5'-phosphate oxidase family protein n=1 Tax=Phaeacidiphilus oryzae TaxID=348818 RepID=UPI00055F6CFF|nr:pyridoxamine 5'-phosphate oxidase family protein [Phaeacidiphilus oryzae]
MSTESTDLPDEIREALAAHNTLTLAYCDGNGGPQACAVFYAWEQEPDLSPRLVFLTSRRTRHGQALAAGGGEAAVAFTAQADGQHWETITGLQGRGRCRLLDGDAWENARILYTSRFPFVGAEGNLAQALASVDLWEITVDWLRLIDNGKGFAHKEEWPG